MVKNIFYDHHLVVQDQNQDSRSLYGLKRDPKLWFEMLSKHLKGISLRSSPTSPCFFMGTLIEGEPPIYV
jgi:hypothetical protein